MLLNKAFSFMIILCYPFFLLGEQARCIESLCFRSPTSFKPSPTFSAHAHIQSEKEYETLYSASIDNPEAFWADRAHDISWFSPWHTVFSWLDKPQARFTWFAGGKLNVSYNCLDRHIATNGNKIALIWQGEQENDVRTFTYQQLYEEVCAFAHVLKSKGVQPGDTVCIYLPMIPEAVIAMLACTRIGAVHSVVFGGFSVAALKDRMIDCQCKVLITADGGVRGGNKVPLKTLADEALTGYDGIESVVVVQHTNSPITMKSGRDTWWHEEMSSAVVHTPCEPTIMEAEDPLFILYTSGTTGKPKGILHTTAGYLVYVNQTFKYIFDYRPDDIYWCTADVGWITGHSYLVYGPLSNGATVVMFEGIPTYPNNERFWHIIEKFKVSIFYTAPTAIRALGAYGTEPVQKYDLSSLRLLGTVGEPINPEPWLWFYNTIGKGHCPIVDTWWQTETGGILISPLPGATTLKPGSATKPFFGIKPAILNDDGKELTSDDGGYLTIKHPWPGCARTIYGDHDRYVKTYWTRFPGIFFTGDAAKCDSDGNYWLMGRVDDVIKVSGHRLGTAEIESALISHPSVTEAAVVPIPHTIKGEALYAFVVLKKDAPLVDGLVETLRTHVAKQMGPIAKPDKIQIALALPKTRSGKIVRRILKAIAQGKDDFGDISTLVNPDCINQLIEGKN